MRESIARKAFLNKRHGLTIGQIIDELQEIRVEDEEQDPFWGLTLGQVVDFITRYRL